MLLLLPAVWQEARPVAQAGCELLLLHAGAQTPAALAGISNPDICVADGSKGCR